MSRVKLVTLRGGGLLFYPETLVKDFKSRAWIRFFIRIREDLFSGYFSNHVPNPLFYPDFIT